MNPRHTAALALVGWYLTVSVVPVGGCLGCERRPAGPVTVDVWAVYPNAADCEAAQRKMMALFADNEKHPEKYRKGEWVVHQEASCGPTNDQMFKAKGVQLKFLSPLEKKQIIRNSIPPD
jgi:hypothetical protein